MSDARRPRRLSLLVAMLLILLGVLVLTRYGSWTTPSIAPNANIRPKQVVSTIEDIGWMRLDSGPAPVEIGAAPPTDLPSFYSQRAISSVNPRMPGLSGS